MLRYWKDRVKKQYHRIAAEPIICQGRHALQATFSQFRIFKSSLSLSFLTPDSTAEVEAILAAGFAVARAL